MEAAPAQACVRPFRAYWAFQVGCQELNQDGLWKSQTEREYKVEQQASERDTVIEPDASHSNKNNPVLKTDCMKSLETFCRQVLDFQRNFPELENQTHTI